MDFDTFDVEETYQSFLDKTGNVQAATGLALCETIRRIVADGLLEQAISSGVRGILGDDESLFDVFFEVAERFVRPLPLEEPSPEPANTNESEAENVA